MASVSRTWRFGRRRASWLALSTNTAIKDASRGTSDCAIRFRRAAVSVGSNIAEGYERDGNRELLQFLSQAKGSSGEVRSHVHMAWDQAYLNERSYVDVVDRSIEVSKMLAGFVRYIRQSELKGLKFRTD